MRKESEIKTEALDDSEDDLLEFFNQLKHKTFSSQPSSFRITTMPPLIHSDDRDRKSEIIEETDEEIEIIKTEPENNNININRKRKRSVFIAETDDDDEDSDIAIKKRRIVASESTMSQSSNNSSNLSNSSSITATSNVTTSPANPDVKPPLNSKSSKNATFKQLSSSVGIRFIVNSPSKLNGFIESG